MNDMVRKRMNIVLTPEAIKMLDKLADEYERSRSKIIDLLIKEAFKGMIHNKPMLPKETMIRDKIDEIKF